MSASSFMRKKILASALITTGLLGVTPIAGDEIIQTESSRSTQEQMSLSIESQLCNQQFSCTKTGLLVQFLPNAKALFFHPDSTQALKADYSILFNRHIVMNVYENPSKHFDVVMQNIMILPEGFITKVNQENRYFQNA